MSTNDTTRYGGFDELMERHQRLIRSLCWWYAGGNTAKTSDLIQDVLLKLWHYRHTLRAGSTAAQERQWVRLHCRSVFEHQRRKPTVETVLLDEEFDRATDNGGYREQIDRLAVDLNGEEQQLLELTLDGYTDGEMAEAMQKSEREVARLRKSMIEKMKIKAGKKT